MRKVLCIVILAIAMTLGAHVGGMDADSGSSVDTGPGMFNPFAALDSSQVVDMRVSDTGPWDEKICSDAAGLNCHMEHHNS